MKKTLVILIHGTWSSPRVWNRKVWDWCHRIWNDVDIKSLDWVPARLSHSARRRGAVELSKIITKWKYKNPEGAVVCVGHSHGGNVITLVGSLVDYIFYPNLMITLGTPMMGFYDDDYGVISDNKNDPHAAYWMAISSKKDIIQWIGSFLRKWKKRRTDDKVDLFKQFKDLKHVELKSADKVWEFIHDAVKNTESIRKIFE